MTKLEEWTTRAHVRVHDRAPGTNGPDDLGARAGCACHEYAVATAALEERARRIHAKFGHPGPVEDCQSPHDVLCKALDWSTP